MIPASLLTKAGKLSVTKLKAASVNTLMGVAKSMGYKVSKSELIEFISKKSGGGAIGQLEALQTTARALNKGDIITLTFEKSLDSAQIKPFTVTEKHVFVMNNAVSFDLGQLDYDKDKDEDENTYSLLVTSDGLVLQSIDTDRKYSAFTVIKIESSVRDALASDYVKPMNGSALPAPASATLFVSDGAVAQPTVTAALAGPLPQPKLGTQGLDSSKGQDVDESGKYPSMEALDSYIIHLKEIFNITKSKSILNELILARRLSLSDGSISQLNTDVIASLLKKINKLDFNKTLFKGEMSNASTKNKNMRYPELRVAAVTVLHNKNNQGVRLYMPKLNDIIDINIDAWIMGGYGTNDDVKTVKAAVTKRAHEINGQKDIYAAKEAAEDHAQYLKINPHPAQVRYEYTRPEGKKNSEFGEAWGGRKPRYNTRSKVK